jgi:hypothetical protein
MKQLRICRPSCRANVPKAPAFALEILEHMRIAQWDILEFLPNPDHVAAEWPRGLDSPEPDFRPIPYRQRIEHAGLSLESEMPSQFRRIKP